MTSGDTTSSMPQERRVSPRISVQLNAVLLSTTPDPLQPPFRKVTLVSISIGGCAFTCDQQLEAGSDWLLRFDQNGVQTPDTAVHVLRSTRGEDGKWDVACVFSDIAALVNAANLTDEHIDLHVAVIRAEVPDAGPVHFDVVLKKPSTLESVTGVAIHADKELTITNSAMHCTLDVAGPLLAEHAMIVGGRLHMCTYGKIGTLGSPDHYLTLVVLGRTFSASLLLGAVPSMLAEPTAELAQRLKTIEQIRSAPSGKLSSSERENLTIAISEAREIERRINRIKASVRKIRDMDAKPASICLEVAKCIHPGVIVAFDDKIARIDETIKGPASIIIDADGHLAITTPEMVVPKPLVETKLAA